MTTTNKVLVGSALALAAFYTWRHFNPSTNTIAQYLRSNGYWSSGNVRDLEALDKAYLKEWFKAAKRDAKTFDYDGNTFNTQGGKNIGSTAGTVAAQPAAPAQPKQPAWWETLGML